MSAAYLGYSFDIDGEGMDLIFPHNENEIAQSLAACDKSNISYWKHNGFVIIDLQKMSKSLGNFFTIQQVIDLYHPLALRHFLIGTHYQSPINYSDVQLESASDRVYYIYQVSTVFEDILQVITILGIEKEKKKGDPGTFFLALYLLRFHWLQTLHGCENVLRQHDETSQTDNIPAEIVDYINKFNDVFLTSMSDDLHSPVVLSAMSQFDPLKTANDLLHTRKGKKQGLRIESLAALEKTIRKVLIVLGIMPTSYREVLQQLREKALKRAKLTEDQVFQKIHERTTARKNKEYEKSDAIRKDLATVGIALMDSPGGTTWRPAVPLALQEQHVPPT